MPNSTNKSRSGGKRNSSKGGRGNYKNKDQVIPNSQRSSADRGTRDNGLRGGSGGSSGDLGSGQGSGGVTGHGSGGGKGGGSPVTG